MNKEKYDKYKSNISNNLEEQIIEGGNHSFFGMYGLQKGLGLLDSFVADAQISLDPLGLAQAANVVAGYAAESVACGCPDDAPEGRKTRLCQRHNNQFGAERNNAARQKCREKNPDISPLQEKLNHGIHIVICFERVTKLKILCDFSRQTKII